jgi:sec-independent protein translocase protein TatA
MGSIGTPELIVVAVLALLVFGPKRLPEIGKNVGAAIREFRRASRDLMSHFEDNDPPRVRSVSRHSYDTDAYAPPSAVPAHDMDWHPGTADTVQTAEAVHTSDTVHTTDAVHVADAPAVAAPIAEQNGHHASVATSAPAPSGEAVAATSSTAVHNTAPAESERNA